MVGGANCCVDLDPLPFVFDSYWTSIGCTIIGLFFRALQTLSFVQVDSVHIDD